MTDLVVNCPSCNTLVAWVTSNRHRPFCSDRCRILDLGEWAVGKRGLPADAEYYDVKSEKLNEE
tara:strand:- start:1155 stop:1346 length:192 start_codon:yes stop_codon:yes gene_type:complete